MKAMSLVQRSTSLAMAHPPLPGKHTIVRNRNLCIHCGIRNLASTATTMPEHAIFLKEVAALEPPASLQTLLNVLQVKGETVVSPYNRKGIIPLAVPLTETQDGEITALLRWPTPASGMDVPVVRVQSYGVTLLAKSPEEFIHRALVEEDVAGSSGRVQESAGEVGLGLYRRGDFEASKSSSVDVFLMKKVGLFPDVFERLALRHFDNGDNISALVTGEYYASKKHFPGFGRPFVFNAELMLKRLALRHFGHGDNISALVTGEYYASMKHFAGFGRPFVFNAELMLKRLALWHFDNGDNISALVTGEYYASKKHFPGFGRPLVFNAELMLKMGRKLEAKDAARCALRSPWWTLGSSYADVASIAGWGEEQIEFMRERVSDEGRREDLLKGKDLAQVAVDQAAFLLDLAAVDCTWDDVREQLANFYIEAGLEDIARFINTA